MKLVFAFIAGAAFAGVLVSTALAPKPARMGATCVERPAVGGLVPDAPPPPPPKYPEGWYAL